ncbi:MAG TPA: short-chain dehydrogenase [Rhodobiaceae bacterium]|jgi:NAD(P)-dependent dehydrogenase (short-subunit alcohol dehydrogenase family)|nr:short-chain dehydrogenase [Rhodobiaceae bacterium]|tara:strand:- start:254 stop:1024 length:771 start_codon:yes stop_codon:yes gene_type:complete
MSKKPVCLIIGAGAGIGGNVGKKFAKEGYHTVLVRRSDEAGLNKLVADISAAGDSAVGRLLNAAQEDAIENLIVDIEQNEGPIEVVVFNLGAQFGDRTLEETTYKLFELGWRMTSFALFRVAKTLAPIMEARGGGKILVTSATSAMRGNAGQHAHAAAIGGRRLLCQTLNAELSVKGIHICHIYIDAMIEAPDTLGRLVGEEIYEKLLAEKANGKDEMVIPEKVADTYYHIAHQHRSAWTSEVDIRPFSEQPWWNN